MTPRHKKEKIAVVFFNLGGPSSLDAVRPFLENLFNDKAIIPLLSPFRQLLAWWIAFRRAPYAKKIFEQLDGSSPLLAWTQQQASLLEEKLNTPPEKDYKIFIAMRYWHPFTEETAQLVKDYAPDKIILLPLYPQFSSTTTGSSLEKWKEISQKIGLRVPIMTICCYPTAPLFIKSHVEMLKEAYHSSLKEGPVRLVFSAHGLPQRTIDAGDPYEFQIHHTVKSVINYALKDFGIYEIDHVICYQSKVGRLKWLEPSLDTALEKAAKDKMQVIVIPIAFVSDHSETLVELDIAYKEIAKELGISSYKRIPALGIHDIFIEQCKELVALAETKEDKTIMPDTQKRICPAEFLCCPCNI